MASMNNAIPQLPKSFDLRDATDHVDRILEVADQVAVQLQAQLYPLTVDPATGVAYVAGTFPRPDYIISGGGITAYEAVLSEGTLATLITFCANYGAAQIAAALQAKLAVIPTLS